MPMYEYECKKCGHKFETLVQSSEEKPKCEKCGSTRLEKLLSTFAAGPARESTSGGSCPTGTCPLS